MVPKHLYSLIIITAIFSKFGQGLPSGSKFENSLESNSDYDTDDSADFFLKKAEETDNFEKRLDTFLEWYYEKFIDSQSSHKPEEKSNDHHQSSAESFDPYDQMQSDQPEMEENHHFGRAHAFKDRTPLHVNLTSNVKNHSEESQNDSDIQYIRTMRNRTKDTWIQLLKENILRQVGRVNTSIPNPVNDIQISGLNISQFIPHLQIPNTAMLDDDFVTEKIRSYYPSCEIPRNTDQELWKDENAMNLYFNIDHVPEENGVSIATATLRLYRIQDSPNSSGSLDVSCENTSNNEEEKLLRISIYWYTKSLKKHRVKRRLSDSKVVGERSRWVELSVRPATRAWIKGKNLGLAVVVEDQDGTILKADKYYKGASCTVGTSTPKPIPTVIIDAARWASELGRSNGNFGGNSTTTVHNHVPLPPTVDICTIEVPQNVSYNPLSVNNLRVNACNLNKIHDQTQKFLEREQLEKFAALAEILPTTRHIRHQRQHMQEINGDPRSKIVGRKVVMTNEELRNYSKHLLNGTLATNIKR